MQAWLLLHEPGGSGGASEQRVRPVHVRREVVDAVAVPQDLRAGAAGGARALPEPSLRAAERVREPDDMQIRLRRGVRLRGRSADHYDAGRAVRLFELRQRGVD